MTLGPEPTASGPGRPAWHLIKRGPKVSVSLSMTPETITRLARACPSWCSRSEFAEQCLKIGLSIIEPTIPNRT